MLLLLPILPLLSSSTAASAIYEAPQDWMVVGETLAFGQTDPDGRKEPARTIQIKFPPDTAQPVDFAAPGFEYAGGKVLLNEWGNLGRVHWGQGGWTEFRAMYDRAKAKIAAGSAVPWKVKAILFTRTDLLHRDRNGVLEIQDNVLFEDNITFLLESFARMEALVEAFSEGAVDVQISYTLERDPIASTYERDVLKIGSSEIARDFYVARFNRGDFDSVIGVQTAAEANVTTFGQTLGRTNGAVTSQVLFSNGREKGNQIFHTQELLRHFLEGVHISSYDWGYGASYRSLLPSTGADDLNGYESNSMGYPGSFGWLRDYARFYISPGMWARIRNRVAPDHATAYEQTKDFSGALSRWSDVRDDPMAKLPVVSTQQIGQRIGATSIKIDESGSNIIWSPEGSFRTPIVNQVSGTDVTLNNQLNLRREGMARIGYSDRDLIIIRYDLADFVINHLGDHAAGTNPPANVMGITYVRDRAFVVVDTKLSNDTLAETNLISAGNASTGISVLSRGVFEPGETVPLRLSAETSDARFTITDMSGAGITLSNGNLSIPSTDVGVQIYKAVAALPSGERVERPFVIRIADPVSIDSFRFAFGDLNLRLTNNGPARDANVSIQLPTGWSTQQGGSIKLGAYERTGLAMNLVYPSGPLGTAGATASVSVAGRPAAVARATLMGSASEDLVSNTFEAGVEGWSTGAWNSGTYSVASEDSGDHGKALAVRDGGGSRFGKAVAFGRLLANGEFDPEFGGYSVEDFPYVNFMLKSKGSAALGLAITVNGRTYVAMISGPNPAEGPQFELLPRVKFEPNNTWQQISYNLASAIPESNRRRFVTSISLGDPRTFEENQYTNDKAEVHWVDDFKISRNAATGSITDDTDAELNLVGNLTSPDPYLRALGAARATGTPGEISNLQTLLTDQDNQVRLNAAAAFTRFKSLESVPALVQAATMERVPYPAVMMVRALAFQDTPESWEAIQAIVRQGRAEEMSLVEAAAAMGAKQDPKFIESLSVLITARSWRARAAGAAAMARLQTDPGAQMLMTFLLEVDPMVRLVVGNSARVDVDPVGRRMEWGSVNDLSSAVRASDYIALTRSSDPLLRSRGYAGLKEDDIDIRRDVASALAMNPQESHVSPLMGLLSDPSSEVRAAAVESLFKMPGQRTFSEMSVLAGENHDEVLYSLLSAARDGKIEIPRSMLERLASHRNPLVRDTVKELLR